MANLLYIFLVCVSIDASLGYQTLDALPNQTTFVNNYNPQYFSYFPLKTKQIDCALTCVQTAYCEGYIASMAHIVPHACYFSMYVSSSLVTQVLNETKVGYTRYYPRNCSDYILDDYVCYPNTRSCVACPKYPVLWMEHIQPGFTLYISDECCPSSYIDTTVRQLYFPYTFNLTVPNITITTVPGLTLITDQLPLLEYRSSNNLKAITVENITLTCNSTSKDPAMFFALSPILQMTLRNLTLTNCYEGVTMLGGSYLDTSIRPVYPSTDISGSVFSELQLSVYPSNTAETAVLSLINVEGVDVIVGEFSDPYQLLYIEPNGNGLVLTQNNTEATQPRQLNLADYFGIYGTEFNIEYYHKNINENRNAAKASLEHDIATYLLYATLILFLYILIRRNLILRIMRLVIKKNQ